MLLLNPITFQPTEEQRIILDGITWQHYINLADMFVDTLPRLTYLEGKLEIIMTTSREHERLKKIIARLIETYAETKDIELNGYGNTTFRREAAARGAEPDECYCLGALGEVPDIAIEITLTSGGIDKLELYRGLGVREVWFWQNNQLSFQILQLETATYQQRDRSVLLPDLDPVLFVSYVNYSNQTQAVRAYRQALENS
ncbi:MAG: Uma2 family endonuclease [Coleofasciculus sp. A1-SPW-01]|uniref:Uma2 family endonuclease n=1 Tax=Coleofasciculus sp. A1-SPW-01 TaxID=3070819 RepID=UPI0032F819CF